MSKCTSNIPSYDISFLDTPSWHAPKTDASGAYYFPEKRYGKDKYGIVPMYLL